MMDLVNQIHSCLSPESKIKTDQEDKEQEWNCPPSFTLGTSTRMLRLTMMKARKMTTDHDIQRQDMLHWYDWQFISFKDIIVKDG